VLIKCQMSVAGNTVGYNIVCHSYYTSPMLVTPADEFLTCAVDNNPASGLSELMMSLF